MSRVLLTLSLFGPLTLALFTLDGMTAAGTSAAETSIVDNAYLTSNVWNDGNAEIAFYEVERDPSQYRRAADTSFLVGSVLVKHDFDREREAKARTDATDTVSAFKFEFFYEYEATNSYQYKRSYVVNTAQTDLRPLKHSFASFDWCSNQYRELSFRPDGTVNYLRRSDDYGNAQDSFEYVSNAYPVALLPVLVRALDFSETERQDFSVVLDDGRYVEASARITSTGTVDTADGTRQAEIVEVRYGGEVPSIIGDRADSVETYWRGVDRFRTLLKLDTESGRYSMTFVESVRLPYWRDNVYDALTRVTQRP